MFRLTYIIIYAPCGASERLPRRINTEKTHTMKKIQSNEYITLGTIAIVDISTPKHPKASMKIDVDSWLDLLDRGIGRVSNSCMYAQAHIEGKLHKIHKLVTPNFKLNVDHINGDSLDNRMSNLRDVTQKENLRNQRMSKLNSSGACGISPFKGKKGTTYKAQIGVNNTTVYLGTFKTLEKAVAARKAAEVELGFHKNHGAK